MTEQHHHDHDDCCHHDHHEDYPQITLMDVDGNEVLYNILFTLDGQAEFGKDYVLVFPADTPENTEIELHAYSYTEKKEGEYGNLNPIESDAEWEKIEEALDTYFSDQEDEH